MIDDNGNRTVWEYDSQGRKIEETKGGTVSPSLADRDDTDTTIIYTYNGDGTVATQTKEDGKVLSYTYDAAHRLTAVDCSATTEGAGFWIKAVLDKLSMQLWGWAKIWQHFGAKTACHGRQSAIEHGFARQEDCWREGCCLP